MIAANSLVRTFQFWNAKYAFNGKRHVFYRDLGKYMQSVGGTRKITDILQLYAERHAGKSIGILCQHWLERFPHVGTFTAALRGTVPDEDLAVIAVSEAAGDLSVGLLNLATTLEGMVATKEQIREAFGIVLAAMAVLHAFLAVEAFKALPQIEAPIARMVDIHQFSPDVQALFASATWIRTWWWAWLLFVACAVAAVSWGMRNLTGPLRVWLDEYLLPFQLRRLHESARLFSTIGAITGKIGSQVMPLRDALVHAREFASPWLAWQLDMILKNHDEHPTAGAAIFDTGIVDRETYYRILDISDYSPPTEVFQNVSAMLREQAPKMAQKKGAQWRWACLLMIVGVCLGVFGLTGDITDQFDSLIRLKFAK